MRLPPPDHKVGASKDTLCMAVFPTSPPPETLGASRQLPGAQSARLNWPAMNKH
jgi:hypothetical protein